MEEVDAELIVVVQDGGWKVGDTASRWVRLEVHYLCEIYRVSGMKYD